MLTRKQIEESPLEAVIAAVGDNYSHSIDDEALGVYSVARKSDGQKWTWRCRGESVMDGQANRGLHIEKFPPDDGSREWLETVARDACKMFYVIDADSAAATS